MGLKVLKTNLTLQSTCQTLFWFLERKHNVLTSMKIIRMHCKKTKTTDIMTGPKKKATDWPLNGVFTKFNIYQGETIGQES